MRVLLHLLQKIYDNENDDSHKATKILIFSNFTKWLTRLKQWIHETFDSASHRLRISIMDGTQGFSKNKTLVDQFQEGLIDIMLVSVKAGGLGITIESVARMNGDIAICIRLAAPQEMQQARVRSSGNQ